MYAYVVFGPLLYFYIFNTFLSIANSGSIEDSFGRLLASLPRFTSPLRSGGSLHCLWRLTPRMFRLKTRSEKTSVAARRSIGFNYSEVVFPRRIFRREKYVRGIFPRNIYCQLEFQRTSALRLRFRTGIRNRNSW